MAVRPASIQPKTTVAAPSVLRNAVLQAPLPGVLAVSLRVQLPILLSLLLIVLLLQGCAQRAAIPVVERKQPPTEKINTHWVSEGETLYAIAWRYNLDANRLAAANGLDSGARIYRGQVLRLDLHSALAQRGQGIARESIAANKTAASAVHKPVQRNHNKQKPASPANVARMVAGSWRWPAQGSLLERFNFRRGNGHKGLDISGRTGQSVHAAHNGVVVYAGSGLPAYGNLLIVKHSDEYLSAYAHNSRLTVREGDRVIAGQKIAELGRTGTTHAHLHFEIRKRGVPIDPLALLPRRSSGLG